MKRIVLILGILVFLSHGVGKYKTFLTTEISQGRILRLPILLAAEISCQAQAEVNPGIDEAVRDIFGSLAVFTQEGHIFEKQEIKVFSITQNNHPLGWLGLLDEMGKVKPITFLVAIDNALKIKEVRVLVYRDIFGDQIRRKSFLRQFQGKTIKNRLVIGWDIDAVTGATISSQSAAIAAKKALGVVEKLK